MTDNTQELDEILFNLCDLSYASFTTQEEADRVADQLDYDRAEAKQAILDWHNKQVEEVLDRLTVADNISDRACSEAIAAERAKLKEVK